MTKEHSCLHQGHVWLEPSGALYTRHRHREGTVEVTCLYCDTPATLPLHGTATGSFVQEAQKAMAILLKDATLRTKIEATKAAFTLASAKIES